MFCNLYLKEKKGVFNDTKAKKLFGYLTSEANRTYKKEIGEPLALSDRRQAEGELLREFKSIVGTPVETQYLKDWCIKTGGRREKQFRV